MEVSIVNMYQLEGQIDGEGKVPRWYSITFDDKLVIEVPIHYAMLAQVELLDYFMVEMAGEEIRTEEEFIGRDRVLHKGDLGRFLWGFGGCLTQKINHKSVEWSVDLKGKTETIELISGSLCVLFSLLGILEIDPSPSRPSQLLAICSFLKPRFGPGSLGAFLSLDMCNWLDDHANKETHDLIHEAMVTVWHSLSDEKEKVYAGHDFHVTIGEHGFVSLTVPGNGCGLVPKELHSSGGKGNRLCQHNLDQFRQQLTLLCGLAKLYQLAMKDLD